MSLWEYLSAIDRMILTHFVRVCSILVGRILTFDLIEEAAKRLIKIIKLIEEHYGCDKITPNLHLSLHLQECSHDFRSEERRVGKSVDLGGRRIIKKKKT